MRPEDGEGDHVRNDDEAHGDILQAPDDGDFRGGTDDAEERENVAQFARDVFPKA